MIITAHRGDTDEPWRLERLKKYVDLLEKEFEEINLIHQIHDYKGNLTITWNIQNEYLGMSIYTMEKAQNLWHKFDASPTYHRTIGEPD